MEVGKSVEELVRYSVKDPIKIPIGITAVTTIQGSVRVAVSGLLSFPGVNPNILKKSAKRFICPPTDEI